MKKMAVCLVLAFLLVSCANSPPTPYPTYTPYPTFTPDPTHTPYPTPTSLPTKTPTPKPSPTPEPTMPRPTKTPVPIPTYIMSAYFDGLPVYPDATFLKYTPGNSEWPGAEQYIVPNGDPALIQVFYLTAMDNLGWRTLDKEIKPDGTIFITWVKGNLLALISISQTDLGILITAGANKS